MAYNILELLIHETQPSNFISLRMMDLHQMPLQNYRHFRCSRVASKRHLHPTTMVLCTIVVCCIKFNKYRTVFASTFLLGAYAKPTRPNKCAIKLETI
jgi:hypothetical protein